MTFITGKHLHRRTFLRGAGVAVGLPLLDAMIPAWTALAQTAAMPKPRMGFMYLPHGAIMEHWTPAAELIDVLMKRPAPLVRTFTENLMAYGLGRRVEYFDQPAIRAIARKAETENYKMSSFILGVIRSDAFRLKRAESSEAPPTTEK